MEKNKIKCCCKADMIRVDNHIICEKYYEDIKKGIEQQQEIIDELNSEEIL